MYAFSVACAFWASHWLATALEQRSSDPAVQVAAAGMLALVGAAPSCPCSWCLPEVLGTLGRGQVNLLLLALLCGTIGAVVA